MPLLSETSEWKALEEHAKTIKDLHLKNLLPDPVRSSHLVAEHDDITLDYSRQRVQPETIVS